MRPAGQQANQPDAGPHTPSAAADRGRAKGGRAAVEEVSLSKKSRSDHRIDRAAESIGADRDRIRLRDGLLGDSSQSSSTSPAKSAAVEAAAASAAASFHRRLSDADGSEHLQRSPYASADQSTHPSQDPNHPRGSRLNGNEAADDPYSLYSSYHSYREDVEALDEQHPGRPKPQTASGVDGKLNPPGRSSGEKLSEKRLATATVAAVARQRSTQIKSADELSTGSVSFEEVSKLAAESITRINEQQAALDRVTTTSRKESESQHSRRPSDAAASVDGMTRSAAPAEGGSAQQIGGRVSAARTPVRSGLREKQSVAAAAADVSNVSGYYDYDPFTAGDATHDAHDEDDQLELSSLKQMLRPITRKELEDNLQLLRYDIHREVQDVIKEQIRQFAIAKVNISLQLHWSLLTHCYSACLIVLSL